METLDINKLTLEQLNAEIENAKEDLQVETVEDQKSKDEFNEKTTKEIIISFANKYNVDHKTALIAITKLIQDGGTNLGRPNMTKSIKGINFELADLRQVIKLHERFGTVRKLAKSLRRIIAIIAKENNWPGTLHKDLLRLNPSLTISREDSVYCSEFNVDNYEPDMPAKIREAIQQREQKIRDEKFKYSGSYTDKKKSGKRARGRNRR